MDGAVEQQQAGYEVDQRGAVEGVADGEQQHRHDEHGGVAALEDPVEFAAQGLEQGVPGLAARPEEGQQCDDPDGVS